MVADFSQIRSHPKFAEAVAAYVERSAVVAIEAGRIAKYAGNIESFLLERQILHLHLLLVHRNEGRGATVSDLQAFASTFKVCSPRHVSMLVSQLIDWGRVEQVRSRTDARVRHLVPKEPLLHIQMGCHMSAAFILRVLNPASTLYHELEANPDTLNSYILNVGELNNGGLNAPVNAATLYRLMSYDAGVLILFDLLWAAQTTIGKLQAGVEFHILGSKIAESFGISRSHFANFIDKAAEFGLVTIIDNTRSRLMLSPSLIDEWHARVAYTLYCANEATRRLNNPAVIALDETDCAALEPLTEV